MAAAISRALVVGGAGFIGRHLVAALLRDRIAVDVIVRPATDTAALRALGGDLCIHTLELDQPDRLAAAVGIACPVQVFHLAAGDHRAPAPGLADVRGALQQDVDGFLALLSALAEASRPPAVVVRAASLAEYGPIATPYHESQREAPTGAHGAAALVATRLAEMLAPRLPFPVVNARLALVYGAGQSDRFLIPSLIRACIEGRPSHITRPGDRRDLMHVDDAVAGLRALARTPFAPVVNLCTGVAPTMASVARTILEETDADPSLVTLAPGPTHGGTSDLVGDPDLAVMGCGWGARIAMPEGIAMTVAAERASLRPEALAC